MAEIQIVDCRLPGYSAGCPSAMDKLVSMAVDIQRRWGDVWHGFKKHRLKLFQRHSNRFCKIHCRSVPADSRSHSHSSAHTDADSHPYSNACADSDSHTDADSHTCPNAYTYSDSHTDA